MLRSLLHQMRKEAGLTQIDLAERIGKPQSFVSRYESGQRVLDLSELRHICKAVGVPLQRLVQMFEEGLE